MLPALGLVGLLCGMWLNSPTPGLLWFTVWLKVCVISNPTPQCSVGGTL